jgi:hypothetical protein
MSGTPFRPFKHASAKTAPAYLHPKEILVKQIAAELDLKSA